MKVLLKWNNPNLDVNEVRVYRSTSTIDPMSLPSPLATLAGSTMEYEDTTVSDNTLYYYRIGVTSGTTDIISDEYKAYTDTILQKETGMWMCVASGGGQTWVRAFNSTDTDFESYSEYFENTVGFGVFGFEYLVSGSTDSGTQSGTINSFQEGMCFELYAATTIGSNSVECNFTVEVQDSSDVTLFALKCVNEGTTGGMVLYYGDDIDTMVAASNYSSGGGGVRIAVGTLKFEKNRVLFTTSPSVRDGDEFNGVSSFTHEVDLSSAVKFVFSDCRAEAGSNTESLVYMKLLEVSPIIDVNTTVSAFSSEVILNWEEIGTGTTAVDIYRDTNPIDTESLPASLTSLSAGVETYTDTTVSASDNYFYRIRLTLEDGFYFSDNIEGFLVPFEYQRIALYNMENTTGSILSDEESAFDASLTGTYSVITGKDGNGVSFGATGTADTGIDSELGSLEMVSGNEFTVAGWMRRNGSNTNDGCVIGRSGGVGSLATFNLFYGGSSGVTAQPQDTLSLVSKGGYTDSTVDVTDNEWHFFCVTWDGYDGVLRVDDTEVDVVVGTEALQTGYTVGICANLGAGSGTPQSTLYGLCDMDKVLFMDRALTATERAILANEFTRAYNFTGLNNLTDSEVTLTWNEIDPDEVTNVVIYRDTSEIDTGSLPSALATIAGGVETYSDSSVSSGTTYYYLIDVQTTGPVSHYSKNISVTYGIAVATGIVFYYDFENTSGSNVPDEVNSNDGTINGSAVITASGGYNGSQGYNLDGNETGYIEVPYTGVGGNAARSFCAWIKITGTFGTDTNRIFSYGVNSTGDKYHIRLDETNGYRLRVEVSGGSKLVGSANVLNDGNWHHVAVVLPTGSTDVEDHEMYVDGVLQSTFSSASETLTTDTSTNARIGATNPLNQVVSGIPGVIDNVRFYDRGLSAAEVLEIYNSGT